ncbi:MAG: hypothetical protein FJX76_21790, partial [Armatimonadetes bacterium]|nr:hypothetical protein [Armatimonadota bacterium]
MASQGSLTWDGKFPGAACHEGGRERGGATMAGGKNRTLALSILLLSVALAWWSLSASAAEGSKWALVVGVDHYDSGQITPLRCAGADARELAKTLVESAGFPGSHVVVMTSEAAGDDRPTAVNVLRRLAGFGKTVRAGDDFVFYFSGHGMEQDSESFLLTADSQTDSTALLQFSSLSVKRVQQALSEIKATRVLKLVDACRNDPRAGRGGGDNAMTEGFARDLVLAGHQGAGVEAVVTLFSCKPKQRSYEGYNGHGYFTYFLVEGLRGAAAGNDGVIRISDLAAYLERHVADTVGLRENGKEQVPMADLTGTGAMSWVLARSAAARPSTPTTVALAQPVPTPRPSAPPVVRINAPGTASSVARDSVMLVGTISAEGGVSEVSVSVNGRDVPLAGAALKRSAGGAQVNVKVPLEVGDNSVVLMATSAAGQPAQAVVTVERAAP